MSSISAVQVPMPRTRLSRSMISSSGKRRMRASEGTVPSRVLAARSRRASSFALREAGGAQRLVRDGKQLLRLRMQIAEEGQQAAQDGPGGVAVQLLVEDGLEQRLKG